MQNKNSQQPAFPPQFAQDSLGRVLAPIPGMTKLEYFAGKFILFAIEKQEKHGELRIKGVKCSSYEFAISMAEEFLSKIEDHINKQDKDTIQIIE